MEMLLGENVVTAVSNLLSLGPSEDTLSRGNLINSHDTFPVCIQTFVKKKNNAVVWAVYKQEKFISCASGS